jgi:8-oxo-dGTP diphosphatase
MPVTAVCHNAGDPWLDVVAVLCITAWYIKGVTVTSPEDAVSGADVARRQTTLSDHPQPSVTVDVVLLTVDEAGDLLVLLARRPVEPFKGTWAIPGSFVHADESPDDTARRLLRTKVALENVFCEQLYTFGDPGRDPRGRVITIAYYALVEVGRLRAAVATLGDATLRLAQVEADQDGIRAVERGPDGLPRAIPLAFDHAEILATTITRIRGKLGYTAIGFELLPPVFTLSELRHVHTAISGRPVNKDSFRRTVLLQGHVEPTGLRRTDTNHRPPELYRFRRTPGA